MGAAHGDDRDVCRDQSRVERGGRHLDGDLGARAEEAQDVGDQLDRINPAAGFVGDAPLGAT